MSVTATTAKVQYTLSTATDVLSVPFYFLENSHLRVVRTRDGVDSVLSTGFSLSGAGVPAGGSLTLDGTQTAAGDRVTIKRNVPLTQLTTYVTNDRFPSATMERNLDALTMLVQQLAEQANRSLQLGEGEVVTSDDTLLSLAARAGKVLAWDEDGEIELLDAANQVEAAASAAEAAASAASAAAAAAAANIPIINYVFEGDSLTASAGDAGVGEANTWPAFFQGMVKATEAINFYNAATSGDTAELIVGEYASQVYPYRPINAGDVSWLFIWAGTNDIGNGRTAAYIYDCLKLEWAQARADGFRVVAFTLLPRTDYVGANETTRLAVNTFIRSDSSLYDVLIEPDVYLPSASDSVFYNADGIHKKAPANRMIAMDTFSKSYGAPGPRHDVLSGFNGSLAGAVTAVDSIERAISRLQNAKLALTGGTMTGTLNGTTFAASSGMSVTNATVDAVLSLAATLAGKSAYVLLTTASTNALFGLNPGTGLHPNELVWYGLGSTELAWLNGSGRLELIGGVTAAGQVVSTAAEPQLKAVASVNTTTPSVELRDAAVTPNVWRIGSGFASATDGVMYFYDFRQGLVRMTIGTDGLVTVKQKLKVDGNAGFNGTTPIAKPAVTGSRGGNAALASLLTELANYGLITDSSSA